MLGELTTSNATNTYKGSTTRAQNFPEWRRASLIRVRENPIKGGYGEKANWHPHWWRRRPRPQLGHKNRHLSQQREHNTEYWIGFSTAITRDRHAIQRQRTTVALAE